MGSLISRWFNDLLGIIFPEICVVCGRSLVDGEQVMCLHCNAALPRTHFHRDDFNSMSQRLVGKAPIERTAAWFHYKRMSPYVKLIHDAKYRDRPELATKLGVMYAAEIKTSGFFDGIDLILPVPMHPLKQVSRGYNQALEIARGISRVTAIGVGNNLVAVKEHRSQIHHTAYERFENVVKLFDVKHADELSGQHLLVVDDVITTGSTIMACCEVLHRKVSDVKISVLTLASASLL